MKNIKFNLKKTILLCVSTFILSSNKAYAKELIIPSYTNLNNNFFFNDEFYFNYLEYKLEQKKLLSGKNKKIVISLLGDCTIGMDDDATYENNFNSILEKNGYDYFISGEIRDLLLNDDLTLANLEVVLTNSDSIVEKQFNFKGDPSNIEILINGGIDVVNISNNHSKDYGEEGYKDTIETLNEYDVDFAGDDFTTVTIVNGKKIGFFGLKELNLTKENIDERIGRLKDYGVDLIVASVHWGEEGVYEYNLEQEEIGHYMIDNGVNIVSGNHPHVIQGIEKYNGGIIAYSTGNFCFGGNKNPKDKDTMIVQVSVEYKNEKPVLDLEIIPCSISSTEEYNDFKPTLASPEKHEEILQKVLKLSKNIEY